MKQGSEKLDPNSYIPLYYQLKEILLKKLESGEWSEGSMIPSEKDLQKTYEVSRVTVRRTIELLSKEGFLDKKRGKGTIVKKPGIEERLPVLKSFTEEMAGRDATKRVLSSEYINPPPKIKDKLTLFPDEQIFYLKRLMIVDGAPLGILHSYMPGRYRLSLDEDYTRSLYEIFAKIGIRLKEAYQSIEASMSTREEILLFGLEDPFPTLVIKRTAYSIDGDPVEYVKGAYHGDRYRYKLNLSRDQ
jgi:GntR family transcriptional regulator